MSKKKETIHLRILAAPNTICGKPIARLAWVATQTPARADCIACLEGAIMYLRCKADEAREVLTCAEERLGIIRAHRAHTAAASNQPPR